MLKTRKTRYKAPAGVRGLAFMMPLLLLLLAAWPAQGQVGTFTLTNGSFKWLEGTSLATGTETPTLFRRFFDESGNETRVEVHLVDPDNVYLNLYAGTTYLRLDTSHFTTVPANPALQVWTGDFDEFCVWTLTAYPGYYYQEWYDEGAAKTYRYYIVGATARTPQLEVVRYEVGSALERTTAWNTWDFGAALQESSYRNGQRQDGYYWITLENGAWTLSCDSYQRPDDGVYYYDRLQGGWRTSYFCPASTDTADPGFLQKAGTAALQMAVKTVDSNAVIVSRQAGAGLTAVTLYEDYSYDEGTHTITYTTPSADNTMRYGEELYVNYTLAAGNATIAPPFRKYVYDRQRQGMNTWYRDRSGDIFGKNGVPQKDSVYYYDPNYFASGEVSHAWTKQTARPANGQLPLVMDTMIFQIDKPSTRYVDLDLSDSVEIGNVMGAGLIKVPVVKLRVRAVPTTRDGDLYTIVRYTNGAADTIHTVFHLDGTIAASHRDPETGPVIRGSLFGGGRMARVGSNTSVTIHNADTIYAVYGGNDIAGWVQGQANITVGTEYTGPEDLADANSTVHPVRIGYLYGGGCGYYTYQGINNGVNNAGETVNPYYASQGTNLIYQSYYFNGKVYPWNTLPTGYMSSLENAVAMNDDPTAWSTLTPVVDHEFSYVPFYFGSPDLVDQLERGEDGDGTIPYIESAHIIVGVPEATGTPFRDAEGNLTHLHNDHIVIDSLFGGAENSFIGVDATGDTESNGVTIDVNGGTVYALFGDNNYGGSVAKKSSVTVNIHDTKLGTEEQVAEENTQLSGYGRDFGIRYLYGGGNKVDGQLTTLNIYGGMVDTAYLGGNAATVANPIGTVECLRKYDGEGNAINSHLGDIGHFIWTNTTVDTADAANTDLDNWESETGRYNVRCLFGGNNLVEMTTPAFIQLHSGGVCCVYGGGNQGDMNNDDMLSSSFPEPYPTILARAFNGSEMKVPSKIGAIVSALSNSKIICDYVYGGCRMANVKNSCGMYLAGGIFGYVTGGNDISGDVGSETDGGTYVILDGDVKIVADVAGGSDGYYHCPDVANGKPQYYDDRELYDTYTGVSYDPYDEFVGYLRPTHNNTNVYIKNGTVLGTVVSGGLAANVGFTDGVTPKVDRKGNKALDDDDASLSVISNMGEVHFTMRGGKVMGNIYGGSMSSSVYGLGYIHVSDSAYIGGNLFAGNDVMGKINARGPYRKPNGDVDTNKTASDGTPLNKLKDGSTTEYENAYASYVLVDGKPYVHAIYGSGNGAYNYDGNRPQFPAVSICDWESDMPVQESVFIDINTSSGAKIDSVFGGGNGVSVQDEVVVLLNCVSDTNDGNDVDVIFGGNNTDNMACVPEVRLKRGIVGDVYGGSNDGNNEGVNNTLTDACGNILPDVSTYVLVEDPNVTITGSVYGGCNSGDVSNMAYVRVSNTSPTGVNYVYGGNNISGTVWGNTLVEVTGGTVSNIYGGSNGHYDYVQVGADDYNVYGYMETHDEEHLVRSGAVGRPDVDSTSVRIYGGTVTTSLYGGGRMGDCRATSVVVDDRTCGRPADDSDPENVIAADGGAIITASIYGGGEGDWENLNNTRRGNVTEATHVDLFHAKDLTTARAYGGGKGGDVMNTFITAHDTWDQPFDAIYGGSWGSNVYGTAHVTMNSDPSHLGNGEYSANELFGGNEFTGNTYKSIVTINSGKYNNIYGGSDGDYPSTAYTSGVYASNNLCVPNSQYIELTFNDGTVDSNLYGGGKMGTTFCFVKDADGDEIIDGDGHKTPDTTLAYTASHANPLDYSYIITNIHGGRFNKNVFGGARGATSDNVLAYALKVVNMDGGYIYESLYGGSQTAKDGYPAECKSNSQTTARPSSIINLTGGTVENNLYGAGYKGLTHGSAYVNLGPDAIDSCVAYKQAYNASGAGSSGSVGSATGAYALFKPGAEGSLSPALVTDELMLHHSLYAGSNWGSASGDADFTTKGFYGGETKVRVDGKGYNTANDPTSILPHMNIQKSIFCSGTSVSGGDLSNSKSIDLWNYGSIVNCQPTKQLESIQRGDQLWFHNTCVELTGATAATSAYHSIPYSLYEVINTYCRGYNVIEFDATVYNTPVFYFYEEPRLVDGSYEVVPIQTLRQYTGSGSCADTATTCSNLQVVDPETDGMQHTVFVLNNGIDFEMFRDAGSAKSPGSVYGFGYVYVPSNYRSTILATGTAFGGYSWIYPGYYDWDSGLGGFASPCDTLNKYTTDRGLVDWENYSGEEQRLASELPYTNYDGEGYNPYRIWQIGKGTRLRETTLLAHNDPTKLDQDVSIITNSNSDMAIAEASIALPATSTGHYYKLASGFTLTGENDQVNLIDYGFAPGQNFTTLNTKYENSESVDGCLDNCGQMLQAPLSTGGIAVGINNIIDHPTNTFGLLMLPGEGFAGYSTEYYVPSAAGFTMPGSATVDKSMMVISGNSHVTAMGDYVSPQVTTGSSITPTMKFYLTYNTEFPTTFLGTVDFTLMEYDADDDTVGRIEVKVYISTIIDEFKPITTEVLAMYNAGRTNHFNRKVVLPATLEENRDLYVKNAYWVPTDNMGDNAVASKKFYLVEDEEDVTGAATTPTLINNLFALNIIPSDQVSTDVATAIGWSHIKHDTINVYNAFKSQTGAVRYADSTGDQTPDSITLYNAGTGVKGYHIGTLDGRGEAVLNVDLTFDGTRTYPDNGGKGYLGKLVLQLESFVDDESKGVFPMTVYVKTRQYGDTIYLASASSVTRGGTTVRPYTDNATWQSLSNGTAAQRDEAALMVGKSPNAYVRTFQEALSSTVYQEGDVIAIIDTVKINDGVPIAIYGGDGPAIEVIRYDGHHHELATESGVYRGPMIQVKGASNAFSASNIAFHGGAGASLKPVANVDNKVPDTNRAFAPIFQVLDTAMLTLRNGTTVCHNWNGYGMTAAQRNANGLPLKPENMGAISLTNNGTLTLQNNVSFNFNVAHSFNLDIADSTSGSGATIAPYYDPLRPGNGAAIYVDGGHIVLPQADAKSAIDITRNYLVDPKIHDPLQASTVKWWKDKQINGVTVRYEVDTTEIEKFDKANVYLTRTAPAAGSALYLDTHDVKSDYITITGTQGTATQIGVRKWFPGILDGRYDRDTIRIVRNTGSNPVALRTAMENENFVSDDGENVFYSTNVNNNYIYLQRCATFQHQLASATLATGEPADDVMDYVPNLSTTCPNGGDAFIYRAQGGFFPYHYTWTDTTDAENPVLLRDVTTVYSNSYVNATVAASDYSAYNASTADTLITPRIDMDRDGDITYKGKAVVTDEAGCRLQKNFQIRYKMYDSSTDGDFAAFAKTTSPSNGWTDTNWSDDEARKTAVGTRLYKGVQITPWVWADRSQGTIRAQVHYADAPNGDTVIYTTDAEDTRHDLESQRFCEGDVITLYTAPKSTPASEGAKFIMWDFDPFYSNPAKFVVPNDDEDVVAYYGPANYWKDHITNETEATAAHTTSYYYTARPAGKGYVTTYNGDVHIYNEEGLAWLISVMNGLNGQQIRQFRFNSIYLHDKTGGYDMKDYLWTPMATAQHKFRGRFIGVSSDETDTEPISGGHVVVKNIIINEPNMNNVALFSHLDSAEVSGIELQGVLARGGQYVGGLVARSHSSKYDNVSITTNGLTDESDPSSGEAKPGVSTTSILTTRYVSGGLIAESNGDKVDNSQSWVKYVGDAVYSGGVVGYGTSTTIENGGPVRNDVRMSGLYLGGVAGYLDGAAPVSRNFLARLFGKGKAAQPSVVANNYVEVINHGLPQNVGGIAGYAENTRIENNYVFGNVSGSNSEGGVAAMMGNNAHADKNYYSSGSTKQAVGFVDGNATSTDASRFEGSGNQVLLEAPVYGVNNLTRVLNKYVREHNAAGGHYRTWRSDLEGQNKGYPLFGEPDIIPVNGTQTFEGCEEVTVNGITFTRDSSFTVRFIDSVEMVDSTLTAHIVLHYGTRTEISDSAKMEDGYDGHGFTITPGELELLNLTLDSAGTATLVLTDTLTTVYGCDSVVVLTLTFTSDGGGVEVEEGSPVLVYPNPTTGRITVEAKEMSHVEVYDNEGRSLQDYDAFDRDKITVDITNFASGIYFIRVHSPQGIVIQKVIKR